MDDMAEKKTGKITQFQRNGGVRISGFAEGNTVRQVLETAPQYNEEKASRQVIRNRQRARHMDMRYVMFLSVCAIMTVMICVHYLKLHAQYTYLQKQSTALQLDLCSLKMENDTVYNEIVSGVDLQKVKKRAIEDLGMTYPKQSQIVTYETPDSDYVKQYSEIPSR